MGMWIYRPLTINSATLRGPRPTAWEPRSRTGLWLMTMRRAWGTSASLPWLSSPSPHTASLKSHTLQCLLEMFLCKLQQVSYDFLQHKHSETFFFIQKIKCTLDRDLFLKSKNDFLVPDPPGLQMCMTVLYMGGEYIIGYSMIHYTFLKKNKVMRFLTSLFCFPLHSSCNTTMPADKDTNATQCIAK